MRRSVRIWRAEECDPETRYDVQELLFNHGRNDSMIVLLQR